MGNSIEVHITTTSRSLNQLGVRNPPVARNTMKFDCEKSVSIICEKTVRYSFVSHLSAALTRERISVSVSDGDVQNQTVNDWAAVSVVVFSDMKKPWFIERIDNNGHPVVSVIYGVDPYPLDRGFDLVREFLKARNLLAQETCGIFMQDNDSDLPGYYQKRKVVVKSLEEVTEDELDGFEMVDDDDEEEEDDDVELDGFELDGFAPAGVGYGNVTEEMMEKKRVSKSGRAYHSHFVLPCFGRILVVVYRLCSTS